jgi:hypothetical protein
MTHTRIQHTHTHKRERREKERVSERKREIQIHRHTDTKGGGDCTVCRVDSVWGRGQEWHQALLLELNLLAR